jgi:hypothetical protein
MQLYDDALVEATWGEEGTDSKAEARMLSD